MKTYTKTVQVTKPRLIIKHDDMATNPREFDTCLGYFITKKGKYISPDDHEEMQSMIENLAEESNNIDEHIEAIKREFPDNFKENVIAIFPVNRYEHGNVVYSLGEKHGFDHSNCGFYIVTDRTAKERETETDDMEYLRCIIERELKTYTAWCNGEVYMFTVYDENGNEIESYSGGFYSMDDIKYELSDEWIDENLSDYIQD